MQYDELSVPVLRCRHECDGNEEVAEDALGDPSPWQVLRNALERAEKSLLPLRDGFVHSPTAAFAVLENIRRSPDVAGFCESFLSQHALQVESLTSHAKEFGEIDSICELGAGKGLLACCLRESVGSTVPLVTVDIRGCKTFLTGQSCDTISVSCGPGTTAAVEHITIDAAKAEFETEAVLRKMAGQANGKRHRVLAVAKHLCAGATDGALRVISSHAECALIAPCCHTKLNMEEYCNPDYLRKIGLSDAVWPLLLKTIHLSKVSKDFTTRGGARSKDFARWRKWENVLGTTWRELGELARRVLEEGRVKFLQSRGFEVELFRYVPPGATPDNVLLRARRRDAVILRRPSTDIEHDEVQYFGCTAGVVLHTLFDPSSPTGTTLAQRVTQCLLEARAESCGSGQHAPEIIVQSAFADGTVWVLTSGPLRQLLNWLSDDRLVLGCLKAVDCVFPFERCMRHLEDVPVDKSLGSVRIAVWPRDFLTNVISALEKREDLIGTEWSPQRATSTLSVCQLPCGGIGCAHVAKAEFDPFSALRREAARTAANVGPEVRRASMRLREWSARLGFGVDRRIALCTPAQTKTDQWREAMAAHAIDAPEEIDAESQGAEWHVLADISFSGCDAHAVVTASLKTAARLRASTVLVVVNVDVPVFPAGAIAGHSQRRRVLQELLTRAARNENWQVVWHHFVTDREHERVAQFSPTSLGVSH